MKYDISALGNALVDTQYMVDHSFLNEIGLEADSMTLASAEEHAPIIKKLEEMGVNSVSDCGGSATNSLVAAANYGSSCHHVCRVADDVDGKKYLDSLQIAGVKHIGVSKEESDMPTGKCLIFVTPDAKRTMSSMLGISAFLGPKDIDYDAVQNSKIFYIEGYMVTSDENFNAVTSVLKNIDNEKTLKALSLSDAGIVHGFRDKFKEIESYGIDMVFCNDDEAIAFAGTESLEEAIEFYKKVLLHNPENDYVKFNLFINLNIINKGPIYTREVFIKNQNLIKLFPNNRTLLLKYYNLAKILKYNDWIEFFDILLFNQKESKNYLLDLNVKTKDNNLKKLIKLYI